MGAACAKPVSDDVLDEHEGANGHAPDGFVPQVDKVSETHRDGEGRVGDTMDGWMMSRQAHVNRWRMLDVVTCHHVIHVCRNKPNSTSNVHVMPSVWQKNVQNKSV